MANWKELLIEAFNESGDDFSKIETTLTEKELLANFDDGFGATGGEPFTAWGEKYVYFPICYDGAEWVGFAPRNPCNEKMNHLGGG